MSRRISKRADRVWQRLSTWYGSRLAEQYGKHPPDDWCAVIDRTDDERLEPALVAVRRESPMHPPTLGQLEHAIPKRESNTGPSKPQLIAELMLSQGLCKHQLRQPWNYFGPVREFQVPKVNPPLYVSHADPEGAQVPACEECGKPSYRVKLNDLMTPGVAA